MTPIIWLCEQGKIMWTIERWHAINIYVLMHTGQVAISKIKSLKDMSRTQFKRLLRNTCGKLPLSPWPRAIGRRQKEGDPALYCLEGKDRGTRWTRSQNQHKTNSWRWDSLAQLCQMRSHTQVSVPSNKQRTWELSPWNWVWSARRSLQLGKAMEIWRLY